MFPVSTSSTKKALRQLLTQCSKMRLVDSSYPVTYIIESHNWSIAADGKNIQEELSRQFNLQMKLSKHPFAYKPKVMHFGSQFMFQNWFDFTRSKEISTVVSYFHGKYGDGKEIDTNLDYLRNNISGVDRVIVPNTLMRDRLVELGIPNPKIAQIPIGVSMAMFHPASLGMKRLIRQELGLPQDATIVGSFQKDGVGWKNGGPPKLIKGPDILVDTLRRLSAKRPIFVLLSGPSRDFVIENLKKLGVPHKHIFAKNSDEMSRLYQAIDCYLITSREEGGPKGLLEALSAGCPVVTTPVGMSQDLRVAHPLFSISSDFSADELVLLVESVLEVPVTDQSQLSLRSIVLDCDWKTVARFHYQRVYLPLMS